MKYKLKKDPLLQAQAPFMQKILSIIEEPKHVNMICQILGRTKWFICQQLRILQAAGLVKIKYHYKDRRKKLFYSVQSSVDLKKAWALNHKLRSQLFEVCDKKTTPELCNILGVTPREAVRQLRILESVGLVSSTKKGTILYWKKL